MSIHTFPDFSQPMRVGFLSPHNPYDRRAFSGTAFFAAHALERQAGLQVRMLGNHQPPRLLDRLRKRRTPSTRFEDCVFDDLDAVIGMVASPLLDRLVKTHPDLPFFHVTDATPAFLRDAYGWAIPSEADAIEARVARNAAACIFSSQTLAARAPADLGCPEMITAVQPFGVNFEVLPDQIAPKPSLDKLNLLFVGIDWVRKGGDIAVATLDSLLAQGQKAQLTIVGRCPEQHKTHPAIRAVGFLNKNRPGDAATLARLYAEAHLLLVPSRADCTPMVVAEAMAFATPVLACDVGGIAAQIGGDGAGRVLPPHTDPRDWATEICKICADHDSYRFVSDAALDRARTALNWDIWARKLKTLMHHTVRPQIMPTEQRGTSVTVSAQ